jgi:hypothetical protein
MRNIPPISYELEDIFSTSAANSERRQILRHFPAECCRLLGCCAVWLL